MIEQTERIGGMDVTFSRTLAQAIRNFFSVEEREKPAIPFFSQQYRESKKQIVKTGRAIRWNRITPGREKEAAGIKRIQERYERGGIW